MYVHKIIGKENINPESWEWLFDHGYIQLIVDMEGTLDILVTAKGVQYLGDEENNPGFFHMSVPVTRPVTTGPYTDRWMYLLLGISLLILFGCIMYKQIKG